MDGGSDVAVMDDNRQESSRADNGLDATYSVGQRKRVVYFGGIWTGDTGHRMKVLQDK